MPNIRNFLDLSTAHLSPATRRWMDEGVAGTNGGKTEFGWFIYANDYDGDPKTNAYVPEAWPADMPEDIRLVMRHANTHGCSYILFDSDAAIDPELATFEDEPS